MRRNLIIRFIGILLLASGGFTIDVNAAPGYLDPSFSQDGIAKLTLGSGADDSGYATAVQPDGKIVYAGAAEYSYPPVCLIARFNTDGSFDTSFGADGIAVVRLGNLASGCRAAALQPDGKIVAAGTANTFGGSSFGLLVRLNANGALDATFDADGTMITTEMTINAVAVQTDGKIVTANRTSGTPVDFELTRYNADGSLDASFDGDGKVRTSIGTSEESATAIALQPDGKIVAAGNIYFNQNWDFAVVRYNADGSLDTSFDGDGKVITTITSRVEIVTAAAVHTNGKIAVGGYSGTDHGIFALAVYNADGSLDTSFDGDGKVSTVLGTWDEAHAVAFQPDGKIIMAGSSIGSLTISDLAVVRYNADGTLDAAFDGDGILILSDSPNARNAARSIALQPDGRIVAAGLRSHIITPTNSNDNTLLIRLNADGAPDSSFDSDGILDLDLAVIGSVALDTAIQADGKIVSVGYAYNNSRQNFVVVRHNTDGSLDTSFGGGDGIVETVLGADGTSTAYAVVIQPDGKIIAAGRGNISGGDQAFALVRYNTDGSLDTNFDQDGIVLTSVLEYLDFANAVALQADGKIVAAGYSNLTNGASIGTLVRYNADGSLDTSFDGDGKVRTAANNEVFNSVAIQPNGKIVVAGESGLGFSNGFTVHRYNADGALDAAFDGDGRVTTPNTGQAKDLKLQTDGKIVVAGYRDNGNYSDFSLARYHPNGALDAAFDGDGKVLTSIGSGIAATSVVVQTDGRIIAGGGFNVIRYNTDGSLNTGFGVGGRTALTNFAVGGIALDALGRAVLAGSSESAFYAVARLIGDASSTRTRFDFDDDGKTDIAVFRPSNGTWYIQQSTVGFTTLKFGLADDKLVPADYDGDGKTDLAVFRNGFWYLNRSALGYTTIPFGEATDIPVPADYDGDGKADIAVFRPSNGVWYLQRSTGGFTGIAFGQAGDKLVPADYDGDGKTDLAVNRAGIWYLNRSTQGFLGLTFGEANDKLVPGDYTGDGKADVAVYRPSNGFWYVLRSEDSSFYGVQFGAAGDVPAPGDYDGDGKFDQAVFRPAGSIWYLNRSTSGFTGIAFGTANDTPIPSAFVP